MPMPAAADRHFEDVVIASDGQSSDESPIVQRCDKHRCSGVGAEGARVNSRVVGRMTVDEVVLRACEALRTISPCMLAGFELLEIDVDADPVDIESGQRSLPVGPVVLGEEDPSRSTSSPACAVLATQPR